MKGKGQGSPAQWDQAVDQHKECWSKVGILQLNKANTSDTEAPFLDLHLSISNGFVSSTI